MIPKPQALVVSKHMFGLYKSDKSLKYTYELQEGIVKGSNEAKSYLAGSYRFKLKEL